MVLLVISTKLKKIKKKIKIKKIQFCSFFLETEAKEKLPNLWSITPVSKSDKYRTSLVVQWLRLCVPNAGGLNSIPGQELDPTCHS